MQLRRFKGRQLPEVVRRVREELGPDAVILHTKASRPRGLLRFFHGAGVEVVAALDAEAPGPRPGTTPLASPLPRGPGRVTPPPDERPATGDAFSAEVAELRNLLIRFSGARALPATLVPFYAWLLGQGVDDALAFRILQSIPATDAHGRSLAAESLGRAVEERVAAMIRIAGAVIPPRNATLAFIGPPGAGKTTTLSKLAVHAHVGGVTPNILSLDGVGLGATRQLDTLSTVLGVPYHLALTQEDLAAGLKRAKGGGLTLVDTPGMAVRDAAGNAVLLELLRAARPTETHLVLPATTKIEDALAVIRAAKPLGATHLVFSKLDETSSFGSLLSVAVQGELPLSYLAMGREVPNDILPATVRDVTHRVLHGELHA